MANGIDVLFRMWGETHFGKDYMDGISDKEVETARIFTMNEASRIANEYIADGKSNDEFLRDFSVKNLFYNCIEKIGG